MIKKIKEINNKLDVFYFGESKNYQPSMFKNTEEIYKSLLAKEEEITIKMVLKFMLQVLKVKGCALLLIFSVYFLVNGTSNIIKLYSGKTDYGIITVKLDKWDTKKNPYQPEKIQTALVDFDTVDIISSDKKFKSLALKMAMNDALKTHTLSQIEADPNILIENGVWKVNTVYKTVKTIKRHFDLETDLPNAFIGNFF